MLFLLAEFLDGLIGRIIRFIQKKSDLPDHNFSKKIPDNQVSEFQYQPSKQQVQAKLDQLVSILPVSTSSPSCTCVASSNGLIPEVLVNRPNTSVDACQALDRVYGQYLTIEYLQADKG